MSKLLLAIVAFCSAGTHELAYKKTHKCVHEMLVCNKKSIYKSEPTKYEVLTGCVDKQRKEMHPE